MGRHKLFSALALATAAAAAAIVIGTGGGSGPDASSQAGCPAPVDQVLREWERSGFSGAIATVGLPGGDCTAAYGTADVQTGAPVTPETVFSIGSISKAFTAVGVLDLVERGMLSLDDRAGELIPELEGPAADATVGQLLVHTAGLVGSHGSDHEPLGRRQAIASIGRLERAAPPGRRYLYSNAGFTLLALIADRISESSYRANTATRVLALGDGTRVGGFWDGEPAAQGPRALGELDDGPSDQRGGFEGPHWALDGNGDLAMSAAELARWTAALFDGQIVSRESVRALSSPGPRISRGAAITPGWVSYDGSRYGTPVLATAGGGGEIGHDAALAWVPEQRAAIAIATNRPELTAEALLSAIGPALIAGEAPPGPADASSSSSDETFSAEQVEAHEAAVRALLGGETAEGRSERRALEEDLGRLGDARVLRTVAHDGELRTYAAIAAGGREIVVWYSLNEAGGIEAVEIVGPKD